MDVVRRVSVPGLGTRIKEARIASGLTPQVLATRAGISGAYWYSIESDSRSYISEEILRAIESVLDVDFGVEF